MRTIIISDVHGCIIELKELLNKIKFNSDKDTLVFTGDLMDRGE